MGLITRILPPDAKNAKLTFQDMDNNLYYLQGLGVSGLTYSANTLTITNPTGGTTSVNIASDTNTFITATTYNNLTNTITLTDNANTSFNVYIDSVSGLTVNGVLSATTISGGTLYGDGSNLTGISTQDTFVTGGTFSSSTITFTNNTGGTFSVSGISSGTNLSKTLFVDQNGNDGTAVKGDITKPYQNLYAAKSAATSGDTIHVLPGTWSYNNTNANGNPFSGPNRDLFFNLWKNGVKYYFSTGSKVVILNQTQTDDLYLFSPPSGSTYQTCEVDGFLELESSSIGADTFGGRAGFFGGSGQSFGTGFTFNAKVKSLKSFSSEFICLENISIESNPLRSYVNISADDFYHDKILGQSGTGSGILLRGNIPINYNFNVRNYYNNYPGGFGFFNFEVRDVLTYETNYVFNVDEMTSTGSLFRFRTAGSGTTEINVSRGTTSYSAIDCVNGNSLNITSRIDNVINNSNNTNSILNLNTTGISKFDFKGNIFLNTTSGAGHPIVNSSTSTHFVNVDTNVYYSGSVNTTSNMISCTGGNINFKGNIYGQFAGRMVTCTNGRVTLNGVTFFPTVSGGTILANSSTSSTGTTSIINSLLFNDSSSSLIDGQYSKINVLNSSIKNSGTGNLFVNTTSTGSLQIHNSTLQSVSGSTINITGSAPLTISNTTSNTNITASTINGLVTVLTELDLL